MFAFACFAAAFILWSFLCSLYEWSLHRFVMHRPLGGFVYPFRAHTLVHHRIFRSDDSYHLQNPTDKETIPMAWWNGPVLVLIVAAPALLPAAILGRWSIFFGALSASGLYYALYEYIHWCMHLPKARRLEQSWIFRRLNGHHLLHHRYMHKNFNVVMPLADLLLGTLILEAKTRFAQPINPAVPNVQPTHWTPENPTDNLEIEIGEPVEASS